MAVNKYHNKKRARDFEVSIRLKARLYAKRIVALARKGLLSEKDLALFSTEVAAASSFIEGRVYSTEARMVFCQKASWALYTVEYLDAFSKWLHQNKYKTILEVCAGNGLLSEPMRERGIDWKATELIPTDFPATGDIQQMSADNAISVYGGDDLLFASWIPYGSKLDLYLLNHWVNEKKKPMILVGEEGACTGSDAFWEEVYKNGERQLVRGPFQPDVTQWFGIRDYTTLVIP
jgi:hypothetical protein